MSLNMSSWTARGWAQVLVALAGYVAWTWYCWTKIHRWWSIVLALVAGFITAYIVRLVLGTNATDFGQGGAETASAVSAFLGLDTTLPVNV